MEENGNGLLDGHEYVDLGLSVRWATCNVGANSPEDYGDCYDRGETKAKISYTICDVAYLRWGTSWRMPTRKEFDELLKNCDWEWTTLNEVKGYRVTGKNGNSIFLPAAGDRGLPSLYYAGEGSRYWRSTLLESDAQFKYTLRTGGYDHGSTGTAATAVFWFGRSRNFKRSAFDSFDLFCSGDLKAGTAFAVIMGAKRQPFVWHPAFPSLYSR